MARTGDRTDVPILGTFGGEPTFAADLTELSAEVASIVSAVPAYTDLPSANNWVGRRVTVWNDTTRNGDYGWSSAGAWARLTPTTGNVVGTTDAAGLINSIPHNFGSTPSRIFLQQYYTDDDNNKSAITKLTVGAITSTTFQVVVYRTDTSARLLNTAVKFDWEALP